MSESRDFPSRSDSFKYTADTSVLGDEDTFDVISALTPLASKWKQIGFGLGLNSSRIDNIQELCRGRPKESIREVISDYLKKRYNTLKFGEPSWQNVVRAIADPAAGNDKELAAIIASEHPGTEVKKQQSSSDVYSRGAPTDLVACDWFHGNMTRSESEKLLRKAKRSCFLVRVQDDTLFITSKCDGLVQHFAIERPPGYYHVAGSSVKFPSVLKLVQYYEKNSITSVGRHILTTPLSRDAELSMLSEASAYSTGEPNHLLPFDWYHGKLSKNAAEQMLNAAGILCFMIRESAVSDGCLVLSVKHPQGISHFDIDRGLGWYKLKRSTVKFSSLSELVRHFQDMRNVETPSQYLTVPCPKPNQPGMSEAIQPAVYETIDSPGNGTGLEPAYATVSDNVSSHWTYCTNLPYPMNVAHVVKIGKSIYVGGGLSHVRDYDNFVMKYNTGIDQWSLLSKCQKIGFGLTQLDGQLLAIGGLSEDSFPSNHVGKFLPSNQIFSFCDESNLWKKKLPPLQTSRGFPSVVCNESCVIVIGGVTEWNDFLYPKSVTNVVEVFTKSIGKWRYTCPLPFQNGSPVSCIFQEKCFVNQRSSYHFIFASVSSLIEESGSEHPVCKWESISYGLPLLHSTLCVVQNSIICIGGVRDENVTPYLSSSFIYKFDLHTRQWSKLDVQLPERRCDVGAVELDDGEVLVVGGEEKEKTIRSTVFRGLLYS